ncbi:MAG: type III polyketide synthase [Bdellovibrionales bacterium]|nr:type III polyketide synthase [Bdellovibrionales bacterium]MBT3526813.1 type III polyketide synthase [Bdellovibrionales bacterium]MBT7670255.1 type III polyketide synthase [Bdellovibrionales bacterium]
MSKVIATAALPGEYRYETPEIVDYLKRSWFVAVDPRTARKAVTILKGSNIDSRCSVLPIEQIFSDLSFEEKNDLYIEAMKKMGEKVLLLALAKADLKPTDIDYIITTSCTGFMIPSVDAYLVNQLKMRGDIERLPVTEMGCAGGTSGLIYAHQYLKGNPGKRVALVSVETPTITFQKGDHSMENFVSAATFADGASCVILGDTPQVAPTIIDTSMYHFPDNTHLMGYHLTNSGLKIVLDKDVPFEIQSHFPGIIEPFFKRNGLSFQDVAHYIFHPGGKKISHMVEEYLTTYDRNILDSKAILREYGNMSSATVIFVLNRMLQQQEFQAGAKGYMLAFGPGFTAQSILLEWR